MLFYIIIYNTLSNFATFRPTRFWIQSFSWGLPTWNYVFNDLMCWICLYLCFNLWAITTLSVDFSLTISPSVMFSSFLYLSLKVASSDCKSFRAWRSEILNDRDSIYLKVIRTFSWQYTYTKNNENILCNYTYHFMRHISHGQVFICYLYVITNFTDCCIAAWQ